MKNVDFDEPTSFHDHVFVGCTQRECRPNESIIEECRNMFKSRISAGAFEKLLGLSRGLTTWKDVRKSAQKGIVIWKTKRWSNCGQFQRLAWMDEHNFKKEELEIVGELSKVWSQIVWRCLYLALIGRLNILWSVNKFARAVTKWTRACDRGSARLISFFHRSVPRLRFCW